MKLKPKILWVARGDKCNWIEIYFERPFYSKKRGWSGESIKSIEYSDHYPSGASKLFGQFEGGVKGLKKFELREVSGE